MTAQLRIVHESEAQRQHIRIKMTGHASIGDKFYKIRDLSSGGLSIHIPESAGFSEREAIRLIFPFEGYAFRMECKARLVGSGPDTARFQFTELDAKQISLINTLITGCMAGSVIPADALLQTAMRENFVPERKQKPAEQKSLRHTLKRVAATVVFVSAGVAGLLFILGNVYEQSIVLKSYQGMIEGDEISIRARVDGTVRLLISDNAERVSRGQPLAIIEKASAAPLAETGTTGDEVTIESPCNCSISAFHVRNGEFRAYGEPLFNLVPSDAKPWISALIPPEKAHHMRLQDDVNLRIAGEAGFMTGRITKISANHRTSPITSKITIVPDNNISLDMLGRPVYMEFTAY